jgi:threonine aldolase
MREAISRAELGDDVYGEDPTVKRLERVAAELTGKEAALLVASGTMGNLVSLLTHARRGEEVIVGRDSHIVRNETWPEAIAGITLRLVDNDEGGRLDLGQAWEAVRKPNQRDARTAAVCIENTHNRCGGAVLTAAETAEAASLARAAGAALHVDGARIFNAAVALETAAADLARDADSITFCLSKGLACPVGSLVCGSADFIRRARVVRSMVGGQMRQAGVIAAAGIVALEEMVDRLAEDHANARALAEGLSEIPGISVHPEQVRTNIVLFETRGFPAARLQAALKEMGVLSTGFPPRVRMVTHYGIERADIDEALGRVREAARSLI